MSWSTPSCTAELHPEIRWWFGGRKDWGVPRSLLRIAECLRLEGTRRGHLIHHPDPTQSWLPWAMSRWLLNIYQGSKFHSCSGQPVPVLGCPYSKKVSPDVQTEPRCVLICANFLLFCCWTPLKRTWLCCLYTLFRLFMCIGWDLPPAHPSPEPFILQAEQSQLSLSFCQSSSNA